MAVPLAIYPLVLQTLPGLGEDFPANLVVSLKSNPSKQLRFTVGAGVETEGFAPLHKLPKLRVTGGKFATATNRNE